MDLESPRQEDAIDASGDSASKWQNLEALKNKEVPDKIIDFLISARELVQSKASASATQADDVGKSVFDPVLTTLSAASESLAAPAPGTAPSSLLTQPAAPSTYASTGLTDDLAQSLSPLNRALSDAPLTAVSSLIPQSAALSAARVGAGSGNTGVPKAGMNQLLAKFEELMAAVSSTKSKAPAKSKCLFYVRLLSNLLLQSPALFFILIVIPHARTLILLLL
jgi:hypothetical protein